MVGTVVLGLIMFNEPLSALKVAGIALVFVGVVMLQQSEFHG
jgi:multidrug transporter EmrE-like cation transporter